MNIYFKTKNHNDIFVIPNNGKALGYRIFAEYYAACLGFCIWTLDDMINSKKNNGIAFAERISAKEAEKILGRKKFRQYKNYHWKDGQLVHV